MLQKWEYLTLLLESKMEDVVVDEAMIPDGDHPKYSPYALMPELNALGAKGWELVSITPVKPGRNHDVQFPGAADMSWARHYFCVFKRPLG